MEASEQEAVSREDAETPPKEVNSNSSHAPSDVTSCPAEASPEVTEPEQSAELPATPQTPTDGAVVVQCGSKNPASEKLQRVRKWSLSKYKVTRQALSERLGRGSRTVDLQLEPRLELLRDDRLRYQNVTRLAAALAAQLAQFSATQRTLGDAFSELSAKTPALHVEFGLNAEAQRFLSKSSETLTAAIGAFTSDMDTLVNKTMEDTMINAKQYEEARMEYDAYRVDLEELNLGPRDASTLPRLEEAQRDFQGQRERFQRVREGLTIKVQLLEENRVKVLQQQLWRLQGALAAHGLSCHAFLQQNTRLLPGPTDPAPSWLEES
ncbi:arfaptin-1-like [Menidia menidia]